MKKINKKKKIIFTLFAFMFMFFSLIMPFSNSVVNAEINDYEMPEITGEINTDVFHEYATGRYEFDSLNASTYYLVPKFRHLDFDILSTYDEGNGNIYLGYYSHNTYDVTNNLYIDLDNSRIVFESAGNLHIYFVNDYFTSLGNVIRYDVDITIRGYLSSGAVELLSSLFNFYTSSPTLTSTSTALDRLLTSGNTYYIDTTNVDVIPYFNTSINVSGHFVNDYTFERIYIRGSGFYTTIIETNEEIRLDRSDGVYNLFYLDSVTRSRYSNGLISYVNYCFNLETSGLPVYIYGWYTFDMNPLQNLTNLNFAYDIDVSFTSNSKGFDKLYISSYTNIMNTDGATIIYSNTNDVGSVISQVNVFNYTNIYNNGDVEWTSLNYRQIFFDKALISREVYDVLNEMGTFTFISNNINTSEFTLRDVFWSIAEVPIITIRKVFDFELLGMNVVNFVVGVLTASIILFIVRKILL